MSEVKTVRVGTMPGRINEYAVEVGTKLADVLEIASLSAEGYEVKVDGVKVDINSTTVSTSTNLVLLTKQVKGNATVRIGQMPGRINEYALDDTTTLAEALEVANLATDGYEVKVDGVKVTDLNKAVDSSSLILLTKQVKGNATVRIGQMPGRINEYALDDTTTLAEALEIASLSTDGYEVKVDGVKVTDLNKKVGSSSLILLTKQVKGN